VRAVIVKDEKCAREWPREKKKVIELIDEVVLVRCPKTRWRKILEKMDSGARKVVREALGTWYDYRGNFGRVGISHAAASRGMDGSRGGGREGYKECPQWRNRSPSPRLGGWGGGPGKKVGGTSFLGNLLDNQVRSLREEKRCSGIMLEKVCFWHSSAKKMVVLVKVMMIMMMMVIRYL